VSTTCNAVDGWLASGALAVGGWWFIAGDKIALTRWDYFVGPPICQGCSPTVRQLPEVYTVKADGTGQPTGFADPVGGQEPGWSPDSSKIAYFGNDFDLHIMNADGTGQSRLTTDSYIGLQEREPEWSPKGTRLVFSGFSGSSYPNGTTDLFTINVDGSNLTNITNTTTWEAHPSWQPVFADTTAPKVDVVKPADGAEGVARNTNVTATFSERMDPDSLSTSTFKLFKVNKDGTTLRITHAPVKLSADALTAKLNPFGSSDTRLAKNTRYKAVVTTGATDVAGNALDQNDSTSGNQQKVWYFTTGAR
jgi:Bacterial Ig-like domain/WD40-like Beta Propeller Repeat